MKIRRFLGVGILLLVLLASCAAPQAPVKPTDKAQIANPASVNCSEKNGKLQIVDTPAGQIGICTFADHSVCEEWSFFRQECKAGGLMPRSAALEGFQNSSTCLDSKGKLFGLSLNQKETALCVLPAGKICELSMLAAGTCKSS